MAALTSSGIKQRVFPSIRPLIVSFVLVLGLTLSGSACAPANPNVTGGDNVSPQTTATTNPGANVPNVTVTPSNTSPVNQPQLGPTTPAIVTPIQVPPIQNTPGSYPNSSLMVDTKWLADHINDQNLVIIDTRAASSYAAGHVNGAINIAPDSLDTSNGGDNTVLMSATDLADIFGSKGVSNTNRIVIYGADIDANAARVFWALEYLGHKDVHILDGGYSKWNKEGNYAVNPNSIRPAVTFTPAVNASVLATKADEFMSLNNTNVVRVDSRNAADFVAKRIPNSINILMGDYLNADGTVKSLTDLTGFLTSKGITPGKAIITNCYVGYRSSQAYFIFRLMGYAVSNYDGSTTEWFADPTMPTQP